MWSTILNLFGSGALGSLIGLLGNWLNQRQIRKTKQIENEHEIAMARVQIDILNAKTDASIKINEAKVQGAIELQDSKAYATTVVVANQKSFSDKWIDKMLNAKGWVRYISIPLASFMINLLVLVEVIKGFMRPTLTIGFTVGFGYLAYVSYTILKSKGFDALTPAQASVYFTLAVDTCVLLATTCVTWWFGDRRAAKAVNRMAEKRLSINDKVQEVKIERD
jgi:hypothetical protein